MPQNSSQNSFNNITYYQHCQNSWTINIVQVTPCQKTQQFKITQAKLTTWIPTKTHNKKMTMSQHQTCNKKWNQQFPPPPPKKKLTLKSILECGAWVLGSWRIPSSSFHSSDGWYFFPWKVRKEGLFIVQRKGKFGKWVSQNGCVARMAKNTRIWKDVEGNVWREVEKFRKVFF